MKPAPSLILFTTLAGVGQGLAVTICVLLLSGAGPSASFAATSFWAATALLVAALAASFFHLGHPLRAWRAALMWRTSWMSREVIVLPAFIVVVAALALLAGRAEPDGAFERNLAGVAVALAFGLWLCTAMIYACIRFIQEWAHPLTVLNYVLLGLSSGLVAACALATLAGEAGVAGSLAGWAAAVTALAWAGRALALRRNAGLRLKSTVQSATGIQAASVKQKSMGMTGGSFNTREFFHGAKAQAVHRAKVLFQLLGFAVPLALWGLGQALGSVDVWLVAFPVQFVGLLAERWFFFAQARHPQNLYYQVVS